MQIKRLTHEDRDVARALFTLMAEVFSEDGQPLSDSYLDRLLRREDFWALAAFDDEAVIGGLTAYTLPLTREECSEIFIYDLAVRPDRQRKGVGRELVKTLREHAAVLGIHELVVPADDEDLHALDFYRSLGGVSSPVTFFSFSDS